MRIPRNVERSRAPRARVSATEAAKNFGRLVDRVREERVTYDIERGGKPVAQIAPADRPSFTMGDFKTLVRAFPPGDDEYLNIVERASARRNRPRPAKSVGTLIDASVLIALRRGQLDPDRLRSEEDDEPVAMAAITASQLLHGVHRLGGAVARTRAERIVEQVLSSIPVIAFDLDIARVHARLDAELSSAGKAVGDADLMIAATEVWLDYRIATRDLRSFPQDRWARCGALVVHNSHRVMQRRSLASPSRAPGPSAS